MSLLEDNNLSYEWWLGIEHSPLSSKFRVYILSHCTIKLYGLEEVSGIEIEIWELLVYKWSLWFSKEMSFTRDRLSRNNAGRIHLYNLSRIKLLETCNVMQYCKTALHWFPIVRKWLSECSNVLLFNVVHLSFIFWEMKSI